MQCSVAEPVGFRSAVAPAPGVKVAFFIFILFETSQKQALNKGELVQPGLVQYCKGREKMLHIYLSYVILNAYLIYGLFYN